MWGFQHQPLCASLIKMLLTVASQKDNQTSGLEPLTAHHDIFNHPSHFVQP